MTGKMTIRDFTDKWIEKFSDCREYRREIYGNGMYSDCTALGFKMDCGKSFEEKYGAAVYDCDELKKVIADVSDADLLGSAIFSRWRYYTHWAMGDMTQEDAKWFLVALIRMRELCG